MNIVAVTSSHDIAALARLARDIWNDYYVPLIGQAQVDYMIDRFQSEEAIADQIRSGYEYFSIQLEAKSVGYFAIQPEPAARRMFLSKLYVVKEMRGRGLGAAAVDYIQSLCKARDLTRLWLTVNKQNPAVRTYQRLGFEIKEAIVIDIGNGYVMDDYRMEKAV